MGKIAFMFVGQGAQKIGMGKDICEKYPQADKVFDMASDALNFNIKNLIFDGETEKLMETENTQPAVFTMSCAILKVLTDAGVTPDLSFGLSIGEYGAHVAAGSLNFMETVGVTKKRGKFMQEEVPLGTAGMVAILGLSEPQVREICKIASEKGVVEPANLNCRGQVAISGENEALDYASDLAKKAGARKCVRLDLSAPFHSSLLRGAGEKLAKELEKIRVFDMKIPVIANVTGDYVKSKNNIKDLLVKQVSSTVLFEACVRRAIADGDDTFVEVGPGRVLCGLLKRIDRSVKTYSTENLVALEKTVAELS